MDDGRELFPESIKRKVLRVTVTTSFLTTFMSSALNLSVPDISAEFNVSAGYVGWIITVYTLVVAACCVPLGKLADITGKGRMLKTGLTSFAVLTFLCLTINSMKLFIFLRALQGISAAMIFATNMPVMIDVHPANERGKALGLSTAATYVGLSAGPVFGGIINHNLGWHYIFIFAGIIAIAALILAIRGVPADKNNNTETRSSLDYIGTIVYIPMIFALLYGISLVGSSDKAVWLIIAAIALFVLFIINENRAKLPIIKLSLFTHDREFTCSNIAALLNYGATFAISYLISIYLQVVLGYSSQTAGLILVIMPAIQAAFSPMMGALSDRIAPYKLATAGMICCIVTLLIYVITLKHCSTVLVVIPLAIGGFGFALFSSPNTNAINARIRPEERGMGNAILSTMRTVGQSLSMCIVTIIVNIRLGDMSLQAVPGDVLIGTIRTCFVVFACLCVIGTIISAVRSGE